MLLLLLPERGGSLGELGERGWDPRSLGGGPAGRRRAGRVGSGARCLGLSAPAAVRRLSPGPSGGSGPETPPNSGASAREVAARRGPPLGPTRRDAAAIGGSDPAAAPIRGRGRVRGRVRKPAAQGPERPHQPPLPPPPSLPGPLPLAFFFFRFFFLAASSAVEAAPSSLSSRSKSPFKWLPEDAASSAPAMLAESAQERK